MTQNQLFSKFYMNNAAKIYNLNLQSIHRDLLFFLLTRLSPKNRVDIDSQEDASEALGKGLSYVNQAFKALEKCNIVIKIKRNYYINSNLVDFNATNPLLDKPIIKFEAKPKAKAKPTAHKPPMPASAASNNAFDDVPTDFLIN